MSLSQTGAELGITRQRVSQRLIEAGYHPSVRLAEQRSAAGGAQKERLEREAVKAREKAAARERAMDNLEALAAEFGVAIWTLGQFANQTGSYAHLKDDQTDGRYGSGKLPPRMSAAGINTANRIKSATSPWSPQHIAGLCSMRHAPK
jgi:hypothetical protein